MYNLICKLFSTVKNSLLDAIIKPTIIFPNGSTSQASSEQITTYIRQFYKTFDEQQCNTISFSYSNLIEPKPDDNLNELFDTILEKYNALVGIHPELYWIYFLDTKDFISFHKDKIVFSINNSTSAKPPVTFFRWYKERLKDLSARSIHIFKSIHSNRKLKDEVNLNDGYWNDFFKSALDLNRFRRKKFEMLDPNKHLSNNKPTGHKIVCKPFLSYFKTGYLTPVTYGYKPLPFNDFLDNIIAHSRYEYRYLKKDCRKMVERLIDKQSIKSDNTYFELVNRDSFFDCDIDDEFFDLSLISVPSSQHYTLIGYREYSDIFSIGYKKWLMPFEPDNTFLSTELYNGNSREEFNVAIINEFLVKLEKNLESLNDLLNEIQNEWPNNEKTADTVFAIKQDISEKEVYLGYLKYFISELFPQGIEVI